MSEGSATDTNPPATAAGGRRRWIPFWVLQLTELVVAFILVDVSVHVSNSGLMVGAAVVFAALAITAHGPLGIFRICRPLLHLTLLIATAAVVAVAPVIPALRPDIEGIIVVEFGAIGLIRLATLTDMQPSSRSRRSAGSLSSDPTVIEATVIEVTATRSPGRAVPTPTASPPTGGGPDDPPSSTGAAARWAGRAAGTASASSRRAVAKHRPEAEAKVRKALRGAGRLAGKVTSPADRDRSEAPDDLPSGGHSGPTPGS